MYPVYHSVHDNFYWLSKFLDPDFRYHLSVAQMWALFALKLADATILPFNLQRGAERIKYYAQKFKKDHQTKYLDVQGIKTGGFSSIKNFYQDHQTKYNLISKTQIWMGFLYLQIKTNFI